MKLTESEISDHFQGDPFRSILHPIFYKYQEQVRNKAKELFKKSQGSARGWQYHILFAHTIHNTFADGGGFHFYVNTRYIPIEPLLKEIRNAGFDIDQVKVSEANSMTLTGDSDDIPKPEVFVRVVKKRRREHETA